MINWLSKIYQQIIQAGRLPVILLILLLGITGILTPISFLVMRSLGASEGGIFSALPFIGQIQSAFSGSSAGPLQIDSSVTLPDPWDGSSRVTLLIMGLDYRDWEAGTGPARSDTMILLTIDPLTKTAGILSIPRDLWAIIPGFDPGKINTAYYLGEAYQLPGGGPALAMKTVELTLGVPIDYYAQIDFQSFVEFIDLIGGVKIDVPEALLIDPIGREQDQQRRLVQPGVQVLPGELALAYARTRTAEGLDFARSARQQLVIDGIRSRIFDFNLLPNLIANAPAIYNDLIGGINTNLPLEDAIRLAVLSFQIDPEDIKHGIIDETYVTFGISPDELSILLPIPDRIRTLRDDIFASAGVLAPITPGTSQERMQLEAAAISILDGTGSVDLGTRTSAYFNGLGANVFNIGIAERPYFQTTIIDHSGNPFTLQFLVELMGLTSFNIIYQYDPNNPADIEIKLGTDWLNNNPMP